MILITKLFFVACSCVCAEMDLFGVVKLTKPSQVTVGVRPLREGEIPILEATAGHLLEPVQEESSDVAQPLLNATPVQTVPAQGVPASEPAHTKSSGGAGILKVDTDSKEERQGAKRKASDDGGEGSSKSMCHVITVDESTDEETSLSLAAHDTTVTTSPT